MFFLFLPFEVQAASDKGVHVCHLLNDFTGGFSSAVARFGVHVDKQRIRLAGPATDRLLQSGDVF